MRERVDTGDEYTELDEVGKGRASRNSWLREPGAAYAFLVPARRMPRPTAPRPFGSEAMATKTFDEIVEGLGVAHRSRIALWKLVAGGEAALPAVRRGLAHSDPAVRRGCCEVLDLRPDEAATSDLLRLVNDSDPGVRVMSAHALTCERCKRDDHWAKRA